MLLAILAPQGATHASAASHNNHWGVPLTLARMPAATSFAVIEIGMSHPGEIAPLARLARLDVALITTVAAAHLEAFDSVAGIAHEKASIFDGLMPGGTAIYNADVDTLPILQHKAQAVGARRVSFGSTGTPDWRLDETQILTDTTVARATRRGEPILFKVGTPGRHFAMNALAALATVEALGADPVIAACDLGLWRPPAGRGQRERILLDTIEETFFDLIDDAFNANPASMAASLDVLIGSRPTDGIGRVGGGRRIAILGDMLELGVTERALHEAIARHPALGSVHLVHCVGPRMQALHDVLPRKQRGDWVASATELLPKVRSLIDAGDVILVKGSKGSKVSLIVDALRKIGQGSPAT
ncbi:MAG: UDP-N-acetylmuramoyl-tripeptide--D-alanyl-D-alanine ligase [Rhodobacterales bacterium 12-65-15]|nr:MAG: UDP-N-acetylmuramoyl-tripeptide--D-alanyl-D-alanine ligase [Rhodobacterales bacterium 12-65-15]